MLHKQSETKLSTPPRTGLRRIALAGLLACGLPLAAAAAQAKRYLSARLAG